MSRFPGLFARARAAGRCALIPYITAGDPTPEASLEIALALARAGADIIELGIPFSDPVADGPVIQAASERALRAGMTLARVLAMAARLRERAPATGILLFGYFNPVLRHGLESFTREAARAGADGCLITDLIPEEAADYRAAMDAAGLDPVFLAAPTSPDSRLAAISQASRGFIYAVSRTGVTGARASVPAGARVLVNRLRPLTRLPIALGFGISTAAQVREVAEFADGAVVGTALVAALHQAGGSAAAAEQLIHGLQSGGLQSDSK